MNKKFNVHDLVYWNDPDEGFSSGYYQIVEMYEDFCLVTSICGSSEAQVYYCELE